jgi:Glutaredoxin-like domain (DUF836)
VNVQLTLLTRAYCHLCDDMREALAPLAARHGARVDEIDVDGDAELESRWGDFVPVLLLGGRDGVELCHYALDAAHVERALAAHGQSRGRGGLPL